MLLVVPLASYAYVFKPRNDEIQKARREVDNKREKLARLREVADKIDDIGLAIEQGREAIELIEAKLPSEHDVEVILEDVWKLADKAHPLFDNVRLEYSEEREFEGQRMRRFEVKMIIAPGADVREVARRRERIKDPTPRGGKTASVRESGRRGG